MELFDLLKSMFGSPEKYEGASILDKRNNFFMIQRRLSIGHPIQGSLLNHVRINKEQAVDIWHRFISKQYHKTPPWMFISGAKKAEEKKAEKINITKTEIEEYAAKMGMDIKSVRYAAELYSKELKKEINYFKSEE